MSDWRLIKAGGDLFASADESTREKAAKIPVGGVIHGNFRRMRNYKFHKKFFALLDLAFDRWQPGEISSEYGTPEKNPDRFRHDVIILAGYYTVSIRLDGSTRVEPKSISFANMSQDEFEKLYNNVLNVLLKRIPQMTAMSVDEVNKIIDQLVSFG